MHTSRPWCLIYVELFARRPASIDILRQITATTFTQNVCVVGWRAYGDGPCRSSEKITETVSDSLEFISSKFELVVDDHVMSWLCLSTRISITIIGDEWE